MTEIQIDEHYMRRAIEQATRASDLFEVPVGAIIVDKAALRLISPEDLNEPKLDELILSRAHNLRESNQNAVHHAEILAIESACDKEKAWRLTGKTLYVTLEPCLMCAGAAINSRLDGVVFGALDPKAGAVKSLYTTLEDSRLNHKCSVREGVLGKECGALLSDFFRRLREK